MPACTEAQKNVGRLAYWVYNVMPHNGDKKNATFQG
jgi:hypothetical protein